MFHVSTRSGGGGWVGLGLVWRVGPKVKKFFDFSVLEKYNSISRSKLYVS